MTSNAHQATTRFPPDGPSSFRPVRAVIRRPEGHFRGMLLLAVRGTRPHIVRGISRGRLGPSAARCPAIPGDLAAAEFALGSPERISRAIMDRIGHEVSWVIE
jgi:hypothetical protein